MNDLQKLRNSEIPTDKNFNGTAIAALVGIGAFVLGYAINDLKIMIIACFASSMFMLQNNMMRQKRIIKLLMEEIDELKKEEK